MQIKISGSVDELVIDTDAATKEVELLRSVHEAARQVIRFNGVDAAKTIEAFAELKRAVHAAD